MAEEFEVKGMSQLLRALDELPIRIERNVLYGATRTGMNVIGAALAPKILAVSKTGRLARSVRAYSRKINGLPTAIISIGGRSTYYAKFALETGAKPHTIHAIDKSLGKYLGRRTGWLYFSGKWHKSPVQHPGVAPRYIISRTIKEHAPAAVASFTNYAKSRIGKEWSKLARKGLV